MFTLKSMDAAQSIKALTNHLSTLDFNKEDVQDLLVCLFLLRWVLDEIAACKDIVNQSLLDSLNALFFSDIKTEKINHHIQECIALLAESNVYKFNQLDFSTHLKAFNNAKASIAAVKWLRNWRARHFIYQQDSAQFFDSILQHTQNSQSLELCSSHLLSKLVIALAAPKKGDRIFDPCAGMGNFLLDAKKLTEELNIDTSAKTFFVGADLSKKALVIASIRLALARISDFKLVKKDVINENFIAKKPQEYDVIVSHPSQAIKKINYLDRYYSHSDFETDAIALLLEQSIAALKQNGRAVIVVAEDDICAAKAYKQKLRQFLVDGRYIEAVIRIAPGLFIENKKLKGLILVLNKNNTKPSVRFADLSCFFANETSFEKDLNKIVKIVKGKKIPDKFTDMVWEQSFNNIAQNNCSLTPTKPKDHDFLSLLALFAQQQPNQVSLVTLSEICYLKSGEKLIKANHSTRPTPFGYIESENIENYQIKNVNHWFINNFARRKQLASKDILLSKKGRFNKLAMVDNKSAGFFAGENILALRLTVKAQERILPEYLLYYLASNLCQQWLENRKKGELYPSINQNDIASLPIILPSLNLQARAIAQCQKQGSDIISLLKKTILMPANKKIERIIHHLQIDSEGLSRKQNIEQTTALLNKMAKKVLTKTDLISELKSNKEAYFLAMLNILEQLKGLDNIPASLFLLNQLQDIKQQCSYLLESITGNYQQQAKLITVFTAIQGLITSAIDKLLANVTIAISPTIEKPISDTNTKYSVQILNLSYLPLRNFQVKSFPYLGGCKTAYLADKDMLKLALDIELIEHHYKNVELIWTATTLAGKAVSGSSIISIKDKFDGRSHKFKKLDGLKLDEKSLELSPS